MVKIEVVGGEVCGIGHCPCSVYVGCSCKRSLAFCGAELCAIAVAVDAEITLDAYASRYVYAVHSALGQSGGDEIEVVCCGVGVEVGAQVVEVVKVFYRSATIDVKRRREIGHKSCKFSTPHVARQNGVYLQRLGRPLGLHLSRHVHELHQVLLAHITVGGEVHLPGHRLAEGVLVHHEMCLQFRFRCLYVGVGKINLLGVHRKVRGEVAHVYPTLFAERGVLYRHVYLGHTEIEGVGLE